MQELKIQLHISTATYNQPHFFIQSNGYNAGRPSVRPYNNSYVLLVKDEVEKGMLFWVCFSLWKANRFVPLLQGSGHPVLNSRLAENLIDQTCQKLCEHPSNFLSNVKELKELIQTENLLAAQIKMIKHIKKSIANKMLR